MLAGVITLQLVFHMQKQNCRVQFGFQTSGHVRAATLEQLNGTCGTMLWDDEPLWTCVLFLELEFVAAMRHANGTADRDSGLRIGSAVAEVLMTRQHWIRQGEFGHGTHALLETVGLECSFPSTSGA
jgi:hypothetical protein